MKDRDIWKRVLFQISRFVSFFLVIGIITTVTIELLLHNMVLDEALMRRNAPVTLAATIGMTFLGCAIDGFRRDRAIQRPLRHILDALERIRGGDFSVRLDGNHRDFSNLGFREISEGVNTLAGELSGLETLRTDFIANVSHEMKTPLAAIQNYAAMLQDPGLPEEKRQEYAQAITRTTRRLSDLVTNILRLNKLENQQIYPQTQVFDLGEQLCESMLEFEQVWEEKQLELDCALEEKVTVEADPELLKLVWANLLSNAVKFTSPGGRIGLKLTEEEGWACVAVSDTGCGMTRETGAHIFEKFYQGDTAHATQGNGLGLALVKRVVDITGGVISVSSAPGKGSVFTVRLKMARGEHEHGK